MHLIPIIQFPVPLLNSWQLQKLHDTTCILTSNKTTHWKLLHHSLLNFSSPLLSFCTQLHIYSWNSHPPQLASHNIFNQKLYDHTTCQIWDQQKYKEDVTLTYNLQGVFFFFPTLWCETFGKFSHKRRNPFHL